MYRGTTPTIVIKLNTELETSQMKQIWVSFDNGKGNVITKDKNDLVIDDETGKLRVSLTQEETLSFTLGTVDIQVRLLTGSDVAMATPIKTIPVSRILEGGVIE